MPLTDAETPEMYIYILPEFFLRYGLGRRQRLLPAPSILRNTSVPAVNICRPATHLIWWHLFHEQGTASMAKGYRETARATPYLLTGVPALCAELPLTLVADYGFERVAAGGFCGGRQRLAGHVLEE